MKCEICDEDYPESMHNSEECYSLDPNRDLEQMTQKIKAIDLFCGCGGMSKGLTDAGIDVVAGIDVWDKAVLSYNSNFQHNVICKDLTKYTPAEFAAEFNITPEDIELISGGPPCQGFSMAGKRDKNDPRNSLFMEYVKYLNYFKPKAFIMENVMGILSMKKANGEKAIETIMEMLNKDYNTVINKLYASDFGVPQNRRRVIIIGLRKSLGIHPHEVEPVNTKENRPSVGGVLQPKNDVAKSYYLSERALDGIRKKKERMEAKKHGFGAQYLKLDKPSYTIPARYWKDGYDALVKYSDVEIRRLTVLELKRIQSFPDDYILTGGKKDQIKQIGNAVACRFAFHLGKYIIDILR